MTCEVCNGRKRVPLPRGMSPGFYAFMAPGCDRRDDGTLMMLCSCVDKNEGETMNDRDSYAVITDDANNVVPVAEIVMNGVRYVRALVPGPATKSVLDLIRTCLDVAGVAEVIIGEETARALLAEHEPAKEAKP